VQIADFGTNYGGVGWLTLLVPLGLLIIVVAWWRLSWSRGSSEAVETFVESAPGTAATPTTRESTTRPGDAAPVIVPIVPAAVLLPLGFAIAVALAVVALWWWQRTRDAPS
jgi:hypothetical protein